MTKAIKLFFNIILLINNLNKIIFELFAISYFFTQEYFVKQSGLFHLGLKIELKVF
jgi:hypothetical protein